MRLESRAPDWIDKSSCSAAAKALVRIRRLLPGKDGSRSYPRMAGGAIRGHSLLRVDNPFKREENYLGPQALHSLFVKVMEQHSVSLFP
jgi:hypothetical protein